MSAPADRHFEQARANRAFAYPLLRDHEHSATHVQWAVTSAFCAAVHAMQGHLLTLGHDPRTHLQREALLADPLNHVPQSVFRAYMALSAYGKKARYRLGTFDPRWVQQSLLDGRLKVVTDFVGL